MEVSYSRHLGGIGLSRSSFYQWTKSLASGHPATSIINSLYNLVLWVMAWYKITGHISGPRFWDFISPLVYGDDNAINVHPDYTHVFNQETVVSAFAQEGFVYTDESKGLETVAATRPLTRISFLKRTFVHDAEHQTWIAPLDLKTTLFIPYWCANSKQIVQITRSNVEVCLLELSLHTEEVWNEWAPKIKHAAVTFASCRIPYDSQEMWRHACLTSGVWLQ
jgi:hypothetical protein